MSGPVASDDRENSWDISSERKGIEDVVLLGAIVGPTRTELGWTAVVNGGDAGSGVTAVCACEGYAADNLSG